MAWCGHGGLQRGPDPHCRNGKFPFARPKNALEKSPPHGLVGPAPLPAQFVVGPRAEPPRLPLSGTPLLALFPVSELNPACQTPLVDSPRRAIV